jgi:hypothetical protein
MTFFVLHSDSRVVSLSPLSGPSFLSLTQSRCWKVLAAHWTLPSTLCRWLASRSPKPRPPSGTAPLPATQADWVRGGIGVGGWAVPAVAVSHTFRHLIWLKAPLCGVRMRFSFLFALVLDAFLRNDRRLSFTLQPQSAKQNQNLCLGCHLVRQPFLTKHELPATERAKWPCGSCPRAPSP